ncbi:unnamed protein product [Lactuca saligna]|uniref:Uncharacterized protein n=1 Tax=Lactuca saligna TaxID=75948 RepID=A0AA36A260_LACSI|nr:unnamed protein product [Lactuca saligna]
MQNPFQNLTTSPPSPRFTPPTSQITSSPILSTIPITSILPLPPTSSVGISLPQISIHISSPIFIDSTPPTTSTVSTPPEVPSFKSVSKEIWSSDITGNTSNVGKNANIGETCFEKIEKSMISDGAVNRKVCYFYLKYVKPHTNHVLQEFTLAYLSLMNPYDWLSLFYIVAGYVKKYEPIFEHLKRTIMCYILEIEKMDVKISSVQKKRPILKPYEQPEDIQHLKAGVIQKKHWSIVYKRKKR